MAKVCRSVCGDVDACPTVDASVEDLNHDGCLDDADGDGTLDSADPCPYDADDDIDERVLALVASSGGSISAEHGIGAQKIAELARAKHPDELAAMVRLKDLLDPRRTLNPGKLFV